MATTNYTKTSIDTSGFKDLQNALDELPDRFEKNVWDSIIGKALRDIILPELKAGLPPTAMNTNSHAVVDIKAQAKVAVGKSKSKGRSTMICGIDNDGFVVRFWEYGTVQRETIRKHAGRGKLDREDSIHDGKFPFIGKLYFSKIGELTEYIQKNGAELAGKWMDRKLKRLGKQ